MAVLAVSIGASWADNANTAYSGYSGNLQLIGPGQSSAKTMPSSALPNARKNTYDDYSASENLGKVYKFTLVGIEAHADADGVVGWYSWGGYMQTFSEQQADNWGQGVLDCTEAGGWWFEGGVNNNWVDGIWFSTAKVGYRGAVQQSFLNTPKVFNNKNITLKWYIDSNSRGIDGYMKILGNIQKNKPNPTGQLVLPEVIQVGSTPQVGWDIDRSE